MCIKMKQYRNRANWFWGCRRSCRPPENCGGKKRVELAKPGHGRQAELGCNLLFFKKNKDFYLFIFRERGGREKERKRNINVWLPLMCPSPETWHVP